MGSNPQKALERQRGMAGTQHTIQSGISPRGAQLHTAFFTPPTPSECNVSVGGGGCSVCVHMYTYTPMHTYSGFDLIILRL